MQVLKLIATYADCNVGTRFRGRGMQHKKQSVLIVDDCPMSRHLLKAILVSAGLDVLEASSGVQCLDFLRREVPALILLDVMMPDVDGFHLLGEIRRSHAADVLPIILVTSCNEEKDIVRGLTSGANDYLTKPFERTTFLARIYNHITLSQMRKHVDERRERLTSLLDLQRALGDMLPEAVMIHNREGVLMYQNEMLKKLCGGDSLGLAHDVLCRFLPLDLIASLQKGFLKSPSGIVEQEFCLINSEVSHLLVRSAVVELAGGDIARIWSFRDVSKLRTLESDMRRQLEGGSLGKFSGELAEYMRALLSHISEIASQLSAAQESNALAARYIGEIGRYVDEGRAFAEKVKALSVHTEFKLAGCEDLNEVLRVVVEAAQLSVGERISFVLEADAGLPKVPLTMRNLSSIFGNVLSNAVDAIDGQGWIRIAAQADAERGAVRIRFDDSGNGMEASVAERVCEPFFSTKAPCASGESIAPLKGLGMWNAYNTVRSLGGSLSLSSKVGSGTSVVVYIPASH